MGVLRKKWTIRDYQRGLLYVKGKFSGLLEAGRYAYWRWENKQIDLVDVRETSQTIEGQEILTSDKIGIRVTLIAQFQVTDPVAARHRVENYMAQLYQDLQLTLREMVTTKTLEQLMQERDALATDILGEVTPRAANYGIELNRVGVKDIVLPGAVKSVFLAEIEADLKGRANLVAARHEVAAARARANTAKLLTENPSLVHMQELELLGTLASKSGNVIVVPGMDRWFSGDKPETGAKPK